MLDNAASAVKRARMPVAFSTQVRTRKCEQCGEEFQYGVGRGRDRRLCSDFCRGRKRHATAKAQPLCVIEGCSNPRGYTSGVCNTHYYRLKRTGTLEQRKRSHRSLTSVGYVLVYDKSHPLTRSQGWVAEHRKVLFDAIGAGPHACHWCGCLVDWKVGRCVKGSLVPDHLDGIKSNNAIVNLVPACNPCNGLRGLFMAWVRSHREDPWLWRMFAEANQSHRARLAI